MFLILIKRGHENLNALWEVLLLCREGGLAVSLGPPGGSAQSWEPGLMVGSHPDLVLSPESPLPGSCPAAARFQPDALGQRPAGPREGQRQPSSGVNTDLRGVLLWALTESFRNCANRVQSWRQNVISGRTLGCPICTHNLRTSHSLCEAPPGHCLLTAPGRACWDVSSSRKAP